MTNLAMIDRLDAIKELVQENWYDDDELKDMLKRRLKPFLDKYLSRWEQCAQMRKLESYQELQQQIENITGNGNEWYYIGHLKKLNYNLWSIKPTDGGAVATIAAENLTKQRTYYTHLVGNPEENVGALIEQFLQHQQCLNAELDGEDLIYGIAFVVVYTHEIN